MRRSDLSQPRLILLHLCLFLIPVAAWAADPFPSVPHCGTGERERAGHSSRKHAPLGPAAIRSGRRPARSSHGAHAARFEAERRTGSGAANFAGRTAGPKLTKLSSMAHPGRIRTAIRPQRSGYPGGGCLASIAWVSNSSHFTGPDSDRIFRHRCAGAASVSHRDS